ncbi:hypothetical protein ACFVHB_17205, partial [Kitasatospora sp. NPDC127111]
GPASATFLVHRDGRDPGAPPAPPVLSVVPALAADAAAGAPSWTVFDEVRPLPATRRGALRAWDGPASATFLVHRDGRDPGAPPAPPVLSVVPALVRALVGAGGLRAGGGTQDSAWGLGSGTH